MDGFVVGIALRQQVPLGSGVENPEDGFQDGAGRDRFAARAIIRDVFFRTMFPDPLPLVITQAQHDRPYREGFSCRQLF